MRKFLFQVETRILRNVLLLISIGLFIKSNAQEWTWAKSLGGTDHDRGIGIAVDNDWNVYSVGTYYSSTISFGATQLVNQGQSDAFLAKFDAMGNPLFAINIGTEELEGAMGVGTDNNNNVYITGYFSGPTLTIGSITLTNHDENGSTDMFVAKFNSDGDLLWAKSAGSSSGDGSNSIAVDGAGNVFITGYFGGAEMFFETTSLVSYGAMDIFTVQYDTDGNEMWAVNAGGTDYEQGMSVATDGNGNSYVTGFFSSTTATFGFMDISNVGINDIFVVKYDHNGVEQWVKAIGGSSYEGGMGVATDQNGDVFITGYFASPELDFGNGVQTTNHGNQSIYVAKYNSDGEAQWANSSYGSGYYMVENIAVKYDGTTYIIGEFTDSDFRFDELYFTNAGQDDIFIIQFNENGEGVWKDSIGGADFETGRGIHVSDTGALYITGSFASSSINIGNFTLTNNAVTKDDVFVARRISDLGTQEISTSGTVRVYPNPGTGLFNLKADATKIKSVEVLNMAGQRIFSSKSNSDFMTINLLNKVDGVYILRIQTDKGFETKKLIIKH